MTLLIGGVAYDPWLVKGSLSHENALDSEPDSLSFSLHGYGVNGAACPEPAAGAEVVFTLPGGTSPTFGGTLATPDQDFTAPGVVGYACSCQDHRATLDRRLLNTRKRNKTAGLMLAQLVATYAPEFTVADVDQVGGAVLGSVRFQPPERITGALERLASYTGYIWDVTPEKGIIWAAPGSVPAPFTLADSTANFSDLTRTIDRSQLVNRITVRGAKYPDPSSTVEYFDGDAVRRHFRLTHSPYGLESYLVFEEGFSSLSSDSGGTWVETDLNNGSPTPGHIAADGYLFTTVVSGGALSESGWLQVVGGNSVWGGVRLMSNGVQERRDRQRYEWDVSPTTAIGGFRCGLWDPNNQAALAGEAHGFHFDAGTLKVSEAGVTVATGPAYIAASYFRLRIVIKAAGGAQYFYQTGANYAGRAWVLLYDSSAGTLANVTIAAAFNHSGSVRVDRIRVYNPLYDIIVTVGGAVKSVGLLGTDEGSGVDCEVGPGIDDVPCLVFFPDTIPGVGTRNIVVTYYRARQVTTGAEDMTSIAACALLEGTDGIHEGWVDDPTLDTLALARARARQELALYANPITGITFRTTSQGLRAGQLLSVDLSQAVNGRTLAGQFLITNVHMASAGDGVTFYHDITATSRLKGVGALLLELLARGKRGEHAALDDGSIIEEMLFAHDTFGFVDSMAIVAGAVIDLVYGDRLVSEEGDEFVTEGGDHMFVSPGSRYGEGVYAD